jgi:hypothetical protein
MESVGTTVLWTTVFLTMGWLLGLIGSFLDEGTDGQAILYSLAAMGGTGAGALLAARHLRAGREMAAAGFMIFAIWSMASSVAGYTGDGSTSVQTFTSMLALPALLLISFQDWSAAWTRGAAALSGVAFAIWGYKSMLGDEFPDIESPIIMAAYILLTISAIGWTLTVREEG